MTVRLYAVLRRRPRSKVRFPQGLHGETLRLVKCAGYSLAVAETQATLEPSLDHLLTFDRVIRALADLSVAILPARFGEVSETMAMLKSGIAERAAALVSALDDVAGCVQMTLRMPAAERGTTVSGKRGGGGGHGAEYLQARASAINPPELVTLRKALAKVVRQERVEPTADGLSVYHLIAYGDVTTYRARAHDYRVTGPFPPYAFVPGIDHAIYAAHDHQTTEQSAFGPARPRARRRSPGNTGR
jgi:hypothetical protein